MNRETRNENRGAHGLGWVCTENREARNVRRPIFQPGPGTRTQKQELRNLWLEIFGLTPRFCHEKLVISGTSEFCRACFGICAPELETPVWNLRAEFCPQFNEIAISDNEGAGLAFFCPWKPELGSAARRSIRSSVSMRRPARAGCKDAPTPPPPIHTRRCALAQPPRRSWPPRRWDQLLVRHGSRAAARGRLVSNLGCTSGRTTFREQPARHPARRSAGSPRT